MGVVMCIIHCDRVCLTSLVGEFLLVGILVFSGLVVYAIYSHCDPVSSGQIEKPDQILPYLVMDKLRHLPGVPGIFVATIYGGVLR